MPEAQPGQEQRMDDLVERLRAFRPEATLMHQAADRLILYREALEAIADHAVQLRMGTDDWFELVEIEQVARAVLSRSGG